MTTIAFGEIAARLTGRRKSKADPDFPTDPVRSYSWDVDDPRAKPHQKIGDGSGGQRWAFTNALTEGFEDLYKQQRLDGYKGPHKVQASYLPAFRQFLKYLNGETGELTVTQQRVADDIVQNRSQIVRMIECAEYHGFMCHVRRSRKDPEAGGPARKQAPNATFFDCERRMTRAVFAVFWRKLMANLKRLSGPASRAAHFLKKAFNSVAQPAPRAQGKELALALRQLELAVDRKGGEGPCPSPT